jgi:predicted nucleotidyltransferase
LSRVLEASIPGIDFALVFGSARNGTLAPLSDIDIAVHLGVTPTPELVLKIIRTVEDETSARCDLTLLNTASEILCFEALKGRLLFVRQEKLIEWADFYTLTLRRYEDTMAWMEKQLAYRGYGGAAGDGNGSGEGIVTC